MHRRALSLAEVLLAVGILTLGILGLMGVFTLSTGLVGRVTAQARCTEEAREMMEVLAAAPSLPSGIYDGRSGLPGAFPPAPYPGQVGYPLQVQIEDLRGLKHIIVTAYWREQPRASLETLVKP